MVIRQDDIFSLSVPSSSHSSFPFLRRSGVRGQSPRSLFFFIWIIFFTKKGLARDVKL